MLGHSNLVVLSIASGPWKFPNFSHRLLPYPPAPALLAQHFW
ncbi:hypothetical protein SLEP1_g3680 [Rubroshorea leprosula]|uniref:Uncharacterized protein n=1 Tax=Rubroshorea leprosula TaxID=152421 RepID=A0AAV5HUE3_9ROSI|nr:hypothetical protein SLEP1_g3680 [Rubroshorea leprosula]